jgi:outer membrane protein OmpA-like peptidoglycan-associated protein
MLPLLALLAVAGLSAGPLTTPPKDFSWGQGQLAFLSQENSACVKDSTGLGLGLGRWFKPRWGWEASFLHSQLEQQNGLWKASEDHLDGSLLFKPLTLDTGRWIPFLRAGLGFSRLENPLSLSASTSTRLNLMAGAGTQYLFGEQTLGTLELRSVSVESSARRQELQLLAGLGYRWGGTRKPLPPPAPAPEPLPVPVVVPPPVSAPAPAPDPVRVPEPVVATVVPPPPVPAPAPAPLPTKIVLGDAVLHFPNNGDQLGEEAIQAIETVAARLETYPGEFTLEVSGHTSSLGPKAHNKALSLRRAQAVAKVLIASGIPAAKVTTVGCGPDKPVADNRTREGQSRNRRVEIDVKTAQAVEKIHKDTDLVDGPVPVKAKPAPKAKVPAAPKAVARPKKG